MAEERQSAYDAESYWAQRYSTIDITKSGHIDLPAAYNAWLYRRKKERLQQMLRRVGFEPRGAAVLDIAAGTGVYVQMWKELGVGRLVGVDISEAASAALGRRFPEYRFHKRDLAQPGLSGLVGGGFELVTAIDMLYHVVDDASFPVALANLRDTVAPGGYLAIHDIFMRESERNHGYIKLRTLARYTQALHDAGFEVLVREPTFFFAVQCANARSAWGTRIADGIWDRVISPLIRRYPDGAGRLTYWIDRLLGGVLRDGPSFQMMICRRRPLPVPAA